MKDALLFLGAFFIAIGAAKAIVAFVMLAREN